MFLKNKKWKRVGLIFLAALLALGFGLTRAAEPDEIRLWSVVEFGHFNGVGFPAQRNAQNMGPGHPMRWTVVETDGTTALLLAERHLFYNVGATYWGVILPMVAFELPGGRPTTDAPLNSWAHSHLSTYLNTDFFNETFDPTQQAAILDFGIGGFYDRNNQFAPVASQWVVVPSSYEMNRWFQYDPLAMASMHADFTHETPTTDAAWVWLRDPGGSPTMAMLVDGVRGVNYRPNGFDVGYDYGAIRPLIRVDISTMMNAGAIHHGATQNPPGIRATAPTGWGLQPAFINTIQMEFSQRMDEDGPGTINLDPGDGPIPLTGERRWDAFGRTLTVDVTGFAFSAGAEYILHVQGFAALASGISMTPFEDILFTTREPFTFTRPQYFGAQDDTDLLWEVVEMDYHTNTVTLLLTNRLFTAPFNAVSNAEVNQANANEWAYATIRQDLNDRADALFSPEETAAIRPFEGDKLFIPAAAQYYRWFPNPAVRNTHPGNARNWWLRDSASPHRRNAGAPRHYSVAMYVTMEIGRVAHTGALVNTIMGVRPAVQVDADFLGIVIPDPDFIYISAEPFSGLFNVATIAGIPFNIGIGYGTEQIPTFDELSAVTQDRALHGRLVLTEAQALGAVPNFIPRSGDNVRVVRFPAEYYFVIPMINLQNGLADFHEGQGEFYFHDGQEVALALDLAHGDIIMVYYRGWNNPPRVYHVVVEIIGN